MKRKKNRIIDRLKGQMRLMEVKIMIQMKTIHQRVKKKKSQVSEEKSYPTCSIIHPTWIIKYPTYS